MSLRARIAVLLSVWVVVMPASGALAQQGSAGRGPGRDPKPERMFHADTAEHLVRGRNGIEIATTGGHYHHGGDSMRGGRLNAAAPWGEAVKVDYFASGDGFLAEINDRISTLTLVDDAGNAVEYVVRVDDREVVIDLVAQNQRMARGGPAIQPWEREGYAMIIEALLEEQSLEFWKSLVDVQTTAPAGFGCIGDAVDCLGAVLAWVGSISALITLCGGTVPSGGVIAPACLLTIITHPVVTAAAALQCGEFLDCLEEGDPHGDCGI